MTALGSYARKKPGPTAKYRAKRKRADDAYAAVIRAVVDERDGHCRYWLDRFSSPTDEDVTTCEGPSKWAHLRGKTRAQTRGMPPEQRHTTADSVKLCRYHHGCYDGRRAQRLKIRVLTKKGADGPLEFTE